jgi:tetratricopeptide (TPR) repeat protein
MIALKRYNEALSDANRTIQPGAWRMEFSYYNRATANEGLGNVCAAYDDYRTALQLQPNFARASEQLTRFWTVTK